MPRPQLRQTARHHQRRLGLLLGPQTSLQRLESHRARRFPHAPQNWPPALRPTNRRRPRTRTCWAREATPLLRKRRAKRATTTGRRKGQREGASPGEYAGRTDSFRSNETSFRQRRTAPAPWNASFERSRRWSLRCSCRYRLRPVRWTSPRRWRRDHRSRAAARRGGAREARQARQARPARPTPWGARAEAQERPPAPTPRALDEGRRRACARYVGSSSTRKAKGYRPEP